MTQETPPDECPNCNRNPAETGHDPDCPVVTEDTPDDGGDSDSPPSKQTDFYAPIIQSLQPPLLVQFNTSDPTTMTTGEFEVCNEWDGKRLTLRQNEEYYYLCYEHGEWSIFKAHDDGFSKHYVEVTTIEILGQ